VGFFLCVSATIIFVPNNRIFLLGLQYLEAFDQDVGAAII
jgi:hypothetical protein